MKANYNVTGNARKALVAAIENLTGEKAVYMRMPTCAYEIGNITVDKEGGVTCEDADKLERIIHNLIADGFTPEDTEEVKAYTHFIAALGKMSRDLKRISATEKEVDNEKYAFRCFLLRLGFIGNEYKAERKILLKNLSGNSSWKNGAPEKEVAACE